MAMANRVALLLSIGASVARCTSAGRRSRHRDRRRGASRPRSATGKKTSFEEYRSPAKAATSSAPRSAPSRRQGFRGRAPATRRRPARSRPSCRLDRATRAARAPPRPARARRRPLRRRVRRVPGARRRRERARALAVGHLQQPHRRRAPSTTWYVAYAAAHPLLARAATLTGHPLDNCEEPQLVRYRPGENFSWHYDAVPPTMLANGGRRLAPLLVYLSAPNGGRTAFRDRQQARAPGVAPRKGRASSSSVGRRRRHANERTLHAGDTPLGSGEKWITEGMAASDRATGAAAGQQPRRRHAARAQYAAELLVDEYINQIITRDTQQEDTIRCRCGFRSRRRRRPRTARAEQLAEELLEPGEVVHLELDRRAAG